MRGYQRVIKYLAIAFCVFILGSIAIGTVRVISLIVSRTENNKTDKKPYHSVSEDFDFKDNEDVTGLVVDVGVADVVIESGDSLRVKSSDDSVMAEIRDNKITIKQEDHLDFDFLDTDVTIYIPDTIDLEEATLNLGVGEMDIEDLSCYDLDIETGTGSVSGHNITIRSKASIECGVGSVDLELLGDEDTYTVKADKGVGEISVDGVLLDDGATYGDGNVRINAECGVGDIDIEFE